MNRFPRHHAFTLVELLVVIAIIGVLVALILPAVQMAREAARRAQCTNNLKQLGLAVHSYHDTFGATPPAWVWVSDGPPNPQNRSPSVGIFVRLLPYLEQYAIYESWDQSVSAGGAANRQLHGREIPTLRCPSDVDIEPTIVDWYGDAVIQTVSSYLGNQGTGRADWPGYGPYDGIWGYSIAVRFADVTDGLSNTFLFGEHYHAKSRLPESDRDDAFVSWADYTSHFTTMFPLNSPADQSLNWPAYPLVSGASSGHHHGGNFCFADGSVRFVSDDIASWHLAQVDLDAIHSQSKPSQTRQLYQWLSTRSDGEVIPGNL